MRQFHRAKRFVNRLMGFGPWRILPFETIEGIHQSMDRWGTDHPDRKTFLLREEQGEPITLKWAAEFPAGEPSIRKVAGRPRYCRDGIIGSPNRKLFSLDNGCVLGNTGIVYDPETRAIVKETIRTWNHPPIDHRILSAPHLPPREKKKGIALNTVRLGAEGFWHFFMESFPTLRIADDVLAKVDWIVANGRPGGAQEKWFRRAGIAPEKILYAQSISHWQFDQVLFANLPIADSFPTPWLVGTLRMLTKISVVQPDQADRPWIWISRKGEKSRNVEWEDRLLAKFPRFQCADLRKWSAEQTIEAFQNASLIAGPHGAGFSNTVFCKPGTTLVELIPEESFYYPCYLRLSEICQLRHIVLPVSFTKKAGYKTCAENLQSQEAKLPLPTVRFDFEHNIKSA